MPTTQLENITKLLNQITERFNESKASLSYLRDAISDNISEKSLNEILTHQYQSKFQDKYSELCNIYSYITEMIIDIKQLKTSCGSLTQPKMIQIYVNKAHSLEGEVNLLRESYSILKASYDARLRYLGNVSFLRSSIL